MEEITVILNGYKRPEYLKEQIKAIRLQTIPPKEIWLWINKSDIRFKDEATMPHQVDLNFDVDVVVDSNRNFKYHGRFALGLLARTKYVAFFDDDTIPGKKWFENCLNTERLLMRSQHYKPNGVIMGGAGVTLRSKSYVDHVRDGWPTPVEVDMPAKCDLVGHAWFFQKHYLNYLWREDPISLDNGEDIQLSFLAQKYGKIDTCTPPHLIVDKETWSSIKAWEYGNDKKASSNGSLMSIPEFYKQRDEIIEEAINRGWKPIFMQNKWGR